MSADRKDALLEEAVGLLKEGQHVKWIIEQLTDGASTTDDSVIAFKSYSHRLDQFLSRMGDA